MAEENTEAEKPIKLTPEESTVVIHELNVNRSPSGTRYLADEYAKGQVEIKAKGNPRLIDRARLSLAAINQVLDELQYSGANLPVVVFQENLIVDGTPRPGTYHPHAENLFGRPAIQIEIGSEIARKRFHPMLVRDLRAQGLSGDLIAKLALIHISREEIFHFVEDKMGILPHRTAEQIRQMTPEQNRNQPHEKRARDFAIMDVKKLLASLSDDLRKPMY